MRVLGLVTGLCILLTACDSGHTYAPVTEVSPIQAIPTVGTHQVVRGETLYEIAWRYGLDYRYLAKRNHIGAPYDIQPGQVIVLQGKPEPIVSTPLPAKAKPKLQEQQIQLATLKKAMQEEPHFSPVLWTWPTAGTVIGKFSETNKGINIAGVAGQPIEAAGAGKVVYAGDGLNGYGNLIIIKHNSAYLSAYAHNRVLFVREGDWVKRGQKIAEMGKTGTNKVMLHFEIRRAGKPLNPISFYP